MERRKSNWSVWGEQDERGALNLITPEAIKGAANLVSGGKVYSLGLPIARSGVPVSAEELRGRPFHFMRLDGGDYAAGMKPFKDVQICDDWVLLSPHGTTHVDALCHVWFDGKLYNGFDANTIRSSGAKRCGIEKSGPIVGRGILLDVAEHKGLDHLPASYPISDQDLASCAQAQGLGLADGDILLIRTGWLRHYSQDPEGWEKAQPGLAVSCLDWLIEKGISAVGADNSALEVRPAEDDECLLPVHAELIRNQGIYIMEFLDLEELARDRVYSFLFVAAPLKISGGSGSPINPIAIA